MLMPLLPRVVYAIERRLMLLAAAIIMPLLLLCHAAEITPRVMPAASDAAAAYYDAPERFAMMPFRC